MDSPPLEMAALFGDILLEFGFHLAAFAIAHYLPLDGTMFRDSRSVEYEDVMPVASFGVALGRGNMKVDLAYNVWSGTIDGTRSGQLYAGVNLLWFPAAGR